MLPQTNSFFEDYDDTAVYDKIQGWLQNPQARNFVVEFGQNEAKIAYDLDSAEFERLIKQDDPPKSADRPVRWM